jgi:predicted TIM-barrel fold metal-dependent hydrolase
MRLFGLPDSDLQRACFRAYNEWVAEFAAYCPQRLVALAMVSLTDALDAAHELERAAKLGAAGAIIWGAPPVGQPPYADACYDPLWQAATDLGMPVSLHCITSGSPRVASDSAYVQYLDVIHDVQRSLAEIVCGGVLERFPALTIVSVENDCGWLPHFMFRLDHAHEKFGKYATRPLAMPPSDYIRRQVYATFQDDATAPLALAAAGEDRLMWASDYPHVDSTWPNSRAAIERVLAGVPEATVTKIVADNAARLYHVVPERPRPPE